MAGFVADRDAKALGAVGLVEVGERLELPLEVQQSVVEVDGVPSEPQHLTLAHALVQPDQIAGAVGEVGRVRQYGERLRDRHGLALRSLLLSELLFDLDVEHGVGDHVALLKGVAQHLDHHALGAQHGGLAVAGSPDGGVDLTDVARGQINQADTADAGVDVVAHGRPIGGEGVGANFGDAESEPVLGPGVDRLPGRVGLRGVASTLDLGQLVADLALHLGLGLARDGDPLALPGGGHAGLYGADELAVLALEHRT